MNEENKKIFREKTSHFVHDLRGSITVLQLFLSSWNGKLSADMEEDRAIMTKEIEKIKLLLNSYSEEYKSKLK
ncbi:MAG: hypothetical protein WC838_05705 [Candidatus Margulisiibacteriota bacterium]|jgi:hypothetical protein